VAGTVAENVSWLNGGVESSELRVSSEPNVRSGQVVRVPFGLGYSAEEQEQLPLVAAKVIYYLRGGNQTVVQEAEAVGDGPAPAADSA
jgi:hypothetical protein